MGYPVLFWSCFMAEFQLPWFFSHFFTAPGLARRASPRSPWVPPACPAAARLEGHPEPRTWCEHVRASGIQSETAPNGCVALTTDRMDGMSVGLSFLESGVTFVKSSHVLGEKMHRHATNRDCRADVPHMIRWKPKRIFHHLSSSRVHAVRPLVYGMGTSLFSSISACL